MPLFSPGGETGLGPGPSPASHASLPTVDSVCLKWAPPKHKQVKLSKK